MNKIYYIGIAAWALLSACTAEHSEKNTGNGQLKINILNKDASDAGVAFEAGKKIVVYNAEFPENTTDPRKIGIYSNPEKELNKDWINQPIDDACGLWMDEMSVETDGSYYFTAISYFDGQQLQGDGTHAVLKEQNEIDNFNKSDFLAARAIYDTKESWTGDNAISLLFHHVLSRLDIVIYLPIGKPEDGLFNADVANKPVTMTLENANLSYKVLYPKNSFENRGLAKVQKIDDGEKANITMLPPLKGETGDNITIPNTTTKAVKFRCQSILPPFQYFSETTRCLTINIDGKNYSYTPESDKIMTFEQSRITTVYLVLYSKKGQNKVELNDVKISNWKTDKTSIGDLIEQE